MTLQDENPPEPGGDGILAAEYVLGVLEQAERQAAAARADADPVFARLVDRWEIDLSPLANAYPPAEPPAAAKAGIDRRLFASAEPGLAAQAARPSLWSSLAL